MSSNENKDFLSKTLPFWLIEKNEPRKEDYYFKLLFQDIVRMNFSIPGVVEEGEIVAVIDTDGGQAIVPAKEFSVTKKLDHRILGKVRSGYLQKIINVEYDDGTSEKIAVFSTKEYERRSREKLISELVEKEIVVAEVIGFTDYSVILFWKGIRLELFNKDIVGKGSSLDVNLLVNLGDHLPVKLKKVAKNGKLVQVVAVNKLNDPIYTKEFNESEIKVDDEFTGIVTERNEQEIKVKVGRNSGEDGRSKYEIIIRTKHPHPTIKDQVFEDQIVRVNIKNIFKNEKKNKVIISGYIVSVFSHYIDDAIIQFRSDVDFELNRIQSLEKDQISLEKEEA